MSREATWTNSDGLVVGFGTRTTSNSEAGVVNTAGSVKEYKVILDYDNLPSLGAQQGSNIPLPANCTITKATLKVVEAFTSAGATTLGIGLQNAAGTAIDADGIDVAIAKTAIDAIGETVLCDGALVDGLAGIGTSAGYVYTVVGTGPYTAGKAELVIEYIPLGV